ncbi:MAG: hypothetical protein GVY36_13440 [Verrucomicrobia bacterium]|jgi:hypothetical protein|nr:hypothetical protein [Verrucomicrobiota bacterium]
MSATVTLEIYYEVNSDVSESVQQRHHLLNIEEILIVKNIGAVVLLFLAFFVANHSEAGREWPSEERAQDAVASNRIFPTVPNPLEKDYEASDFEVQVLTKLQKEISDFLTNHVLLCDGRLLMATDSRIVESMLFNFQENIADSFLVTNFNAVDEMRSRWNFRHTSGGPMPPGGLHLWSQTTWEISFSERANLPSHLQGWGDFEFVGKLSRRIEANSDGTLNI